MDRLAFLAGEALRAELVQRDAERVDVEARLRVAETASGGGKAGVPILQPTWVLWGADADRQHDVVGLDVAVDHAEPVQRVQGARDLGAEFGGVWP